MSGARRGRLSDPAAAPRRGERSETLARFGGAEVEQILSGELDGPVDYLQDHHEWVVVLDGAGSVEIEGETVVLGAGDWILIPAGTPHRLVETRPGTSWLAFRAGP